MTLQDAAARRRDPRVARTVHALAARNFEFSRWMEHLGPDLLNNNALTSTLRELSISDNAFIRPVADNKAFDGQPFTKARFDAWKAEHDELLELEVLAAPMQTIYREYRLFVVNDKIATGSQYMQGGRPLLSNDIDPDAVVYVNDAISRWQPAAAFVIDIALTSNGYRIVEFNNINSSGFYASDLDRSVNSIQEAFA